MKKIALLCIILLNISACKKDTIDPNENPKSDYLIFGTYYGFCIGKCFQAYKIDNSDVYQDTRVDVFNFYDNNLNFDWQKLSSEKYQAIKNVKESFPNELFKSSETVFGMPDAHDQGGWYIEVSLNGEKKSWKVDTVIERLPDYLQAFVEKLQKAKINLK